MCIVHHDGRVVGVGDLDEGWEVDDVSVHGEHPVTGDELSAAGGRVRQEALQLPVGAVVVAADLPEGETSPVQDAGVVVVNIDNNFDKATLATGIPRQDTWSQGGVAQPDQGVNAFGP